MKPSFLPRLINPPTEDPGLFVPFRFKRRALLFDLGDLARLSPRDLLKVSHVFVSHAHVDHFIGFDALLRVLLGREKTLHLYGPPDFSRHVAGKLAGYHWNLIHAYPHVLAFEVHEIHPGEIRTTTFSSRNAFRASGPQQTTAAGGAILSEPAFTVSAAVLDHRIPCLAFAMEERLKVQIIKEGVEALGLPVGPWLTRFKARIQERPDPGEPFRIMWKNQQGGSGEEIFQIGELSRKIARTGRGMKIAYVTDAAGSRGNASRITALAADADILFIEGAFLYEDLSIARKTFHLTAREAGALARKAGAKSLQLFHFSHRYTGREAELIDEAQAAFHDDSLSVDQEKATKAEDPPETPVTR